MALGKLAQEDPTFKVATDQETGQTIISGMGELHLEILVDRMFREFGVSANVGKPQVAYRETIRKKADAEGKFIRQTGGRGQYGHVKIIVEPNEPGKGCGICQQDRGWDRCPRSILAPVEKGVREALETGVLAGYEVQDVKVTLYDGSYHEVDSSEMAFKIAGSMAVKEALPKSKPVLLEPIMKVEVVVPEEFMGPVVGDLNSRRGRIETTEPRAGSQVVTAVVPLSEMFGYSTDFVPRPREEPLTPCISIHYEQAPKLVSDEIVAKVQGRV